MSEPSHYPILARLIKDHPWITLNEDTCTLECKCGEGLAFQKRVIEKLQEANADQLIVHICKDAYPWLEEHRECGGTAFAA